MGGRGDVDRRVPRADHQHVAADLAVLEGLRVRLEDEVERLPDARQVFALDAERGRPAEADAEEDGVILAEQPGDLVGRRRDGSGGGRCRSRGSWRSRTGRTRSRSCRRRCRACRARRGRRGPRRRRRRGRAAAVHGHSSSPAGPEPMTATRRPGRRAGLEEADAAGRGGVAGEPLEPADLDRRLHEAAVDARPLAEDLGRAGPGAAPAEDVGLEDRPRGADLVAVEDLADELRDVDRGRAGPGARGVEAVEAAGGLGQGLVGRQRRREVREVRGQLLAADRRRLAIASS